MNLVQTQYHLRDLPDSEIKAFADGKDPATVPEWLAASEMQRRQRMEMASNKAPQKSVKERLEETMGLKALQAQRQQQAGQQMGEQAMAMPTIPENVPQPEAQPEVQEAAAGGLMSGIAKLPVEMFHQAAYAGGGIVAFDNGGDVNQEKINKLAKEQARDWAYHSLGPKGVSSPMYSELLQKIREPEQEIEKPEDIIAKRKALLEQQGVRPAGEGQERRIQERGVAYEQEKKDRAFNNLIASMSAYGRPNITGRGQGSDYANTAVRGFEAGRVEDRQFQDAQDKLRDAIEAQRRAELVGNVDMAQKSVQDQIKAKADMARARLTAMGEGARIDATKATAGLSYLSDQEKIALMKQANKIQLAQLEKNPDAIRGANALIKAAKEEGSKVPTLQEALIIYGQSSAGYLGREAGIDQQKEKLIQERYDKRRPYPEAMIDSIRQKEPEKAAQYEAANKAVMDKVRKEVMGDNASSGQGGGTQSGNTRIRLDDKGNIIK